MKSLRRAHTDHHLTVRAPRARFTGELVSLVPCVGEESEGIVLQLVVGNELPGIHSIFIHACLA